jgi:hypothetical protein
MYTSLVPERILFAFDIEEFLHQYPANLNIPAPKIGHYKWAPKYKMIF